MYYIYVIGPDEPPVKIGITGDYEQRLKSLQTGHSQKLHIHYLEEVEIGLARLYEGIIHKNLKLQQTHGEWFNIPIEDAINEIKWCSIRYGNETNIANKLKMGVIKRY
jgi:hypothetical protein